MKVKCLLIVLLLTAGVYANHPVLVEINRAYIEHPVLTMDVLYKVYPNPATDQTIDVAKGKIIKDGIKLFQQQAEIITIKSANEICVIDQSAKNIILSKRELTDIQATDVLSLDIVELYKENILINIKQVSNNEGFIAVKFVNGFYDSLTIYYDSKTHLINKLDLYYGTPQQLTKDSQLSGKPHLQMIFSNIVYTVQNPALFNMSNYVIKQPDENWVVTERFKNYELRNFINTRY